MIRAFLALFVLALLLAGCGGDFASPTMTDYETTTTTTTTTAAADLAQRDNRPVCVGLVILGSCNTTATQTQAVSRPANAPAPAPAGDAPILAVVCNSFLIAAAITALFIMLMIGLRAIFGDRNAATD